MLQIIETINTAVNNFIWGVPAMVCIFGVGLYLSIRTNFLQIRKFPYAIKTTLGRIFRKRDASDGVNRSATWADNKPGEYGSDTVLFFCSQLI